MNFAVKSWRQQFGFIRYISRFDFYVLLFGSGIAGYFTLSSEPPFIVFAALLALVLILGAGAIRFKFFSVNMAPVLIGCVFCILGFSSAVSHTASVNTALLPDDERAFWVSGWVEGQDRGRTGPRFMINVKELEGVTSPPQRVRVRSKGEGIKIGDFIRVRAVMSGPPSPATPGGYNSRRAAYFLSLIHI